MFRVGVVGSTRAYKPWSTPTASSRSGSQERRLAVFSHQTPCNRRVACEAAASHGEDRHSRPASPRRWSGPLRSRAEPGCADSPRSFAREGLPPRVPAGTPRRRPDVLRSCAVLLPALPRTRQRAMKHAPGAETPTKGQARVPVTLAEPNIPILHLPETASPSNRRSYFSVIFIGFSTFISNLSWLPARVPPENS